LKILSLLETVFGTAFNRVQTATAQLMQSACSRMRMRIKGGHYKF